MKKVKYVLLLFVCSLFVSCNFSEELYLNEDGTGKISISFDGDDFMKAMSENGLEDSKEPEKAIDSIIHFKDFIKEHRDSIAKLSADEQAKIKKLENFSMHMLMNEEKGEMKFKLFTEFKSINKVGDMFSTFKDARIAQPNGDNTMQSSPMMEEENPTEVSYNFSKNTFSRQTKIIDDDAFEKMKSQFANGASFLGGSKYKLTYHFPKKIKSVSVKEATLSQDGKTLFLEVDFAEYIKNPNALDITVKLKK